MVHDTTTQKGLTPQTGREIVIYIFDIDGTLADLTHRLHHIQKEPKDWRGFFADCGKDEPIADVAYTAQVLADAGEEIVLITGRSDEIKAQTELWLAQHSIPCHRLYMRKAGDHREDSIVKAELLDELKAWLPTRRLPDQLIAIAGVFEDRKRVVDMYRAKGLRVFQVADGNF